MASKPQRPPRASKDALTKQLLKAVDEMQDLAPGSVAEAHAAPESAFGRVPWKMAVRFIFPKGTSYDDVFITLRDWRDDRRIERAIGAQRLSRIQVQYQNKKGRGSRGEYTISEIGPWELSISRGMERVGIRDDRLEPLTERYGSDSDSPSYVTGVIVWFSEATTKEIRLGKRDVKVKPKKAKAPRAKAPKRKRRT